MSLHPHAPNAQKGARYLRLLDQALCHGAWSEVPELARKVEKHAPERKYLTLAARAECQVVTASHRPTSASSATTTRFHGLSELVPGLKEAVAAAGSTHPDDAVIAGTCLAEIFWLQEAPLDAIKTLNTDVGESFVQSDTTALGWLEVCRVKAAYIHAMCTEVIGRQSEARQNYHAAVVRFRGSRSPELRRWTETLLATACLYSIKTLPSPSVGDIGETYTAFKAWGNYWDVVPANEETATSGLDITRRQVWKAYFDLLSTILQHGLVFNPSPRSSEDLFMVPTSTTNDASLKLRQRLEMQRVESTYESLLLAETKFPKASQSSLEVEGWAQQVMANWKIYTGADWHDEELGDGGKRGVSRSVLNILYRAAAKSFHSTPILRHLFTVHAALGEFDLATKAFEVYLEFMDKGKARAEKTGKHETGFDDDDTAILTAAEAVRMLCRYSDREHVEKAVAVTRFMQKWLDQAAKNGDLGLKRTTLAANYRALGISQAHWAQLTYESEARAGLLADAGRHLARAEQYDPDNIDTAYALALVRAETRDVSDAIEIIRGVLAPRGIVANGTLTNGDVALNPPSDRARRLIPLWHLLALCLTAQQDYEGAGQMCQAAFKQFGDPRVLFGRRMDTILRDPEKATLQTSRGLADHMEGFEKECILQVKMTEIMLLEVTDGAEVAVELTDELLGLYSRLFGKLATKPGMPETRPVPIHEIRHGFGIVIQTWLFIAGLYIRAELYDDAQNAFQNAARFVEIWEVELTELTKRSESGAINARKCFHRGWGGGKSIDELWADVWSTKAQLAIARQHPFEAMEFYEEALSYFPDHAAGIVGISNLLMDIYEEKMPAEEPISGEAKTAVPRPESSASSNAAAPARLNRLACRERAYGLLANLTKLGSGWMDSDAWMALARAHDLIGEVTQAKKALWWAMELEEEGAMRAWREGTTGLYAL